MRAGRILGAALLALLVVLLTVLTQIGGVVLLISWRLAYWPGLLHGRARMAAAAAIFVVIHMVASEAVIPFAAPHIADRVRLPCGWAGSTMLEPASVVFCLANRNYVAALTYEMAMALAADARTADPTGQVLYLDAGFPFVDGWPLLPHLSHRDGHSIDLALAYRDGDTGLALPGRTRSPVGYGAFEQPAAGRTAACPDGGWFGLRWNLAWLQPLFPDYVIDRERTAQMLRWLVGPGRHFGVRRVLIEPHLEATLGVTSDMLRFQGCHAARHDDHLHVDVGD